MQSNDCWIADNHTFDIISEDANGKHHRLYLTAFFDARIGIFTGCYVTLASGSQSTLIALRKGFMKYGIPKNIYVYNGRKFLIYDIDFNETPYGSEVAADRSKPRMQVYQENPISRAKLAPKIDISQTALSYYRRSIYEGDVGALERKVNKFLNAEESA